ncbi:MAG: TolC family protein, partial [Acidobacteria bacterium]|nr:TolC family protein [Acidobacteriota bacterium]
EVRAAYLDLRAADQQLKAAQQTVDLASQELAQTRDRFVAGVAGNVEVVQAQEAVASATESYISSLYAHNLAKASLAHAIGTGS